MTARDLNVPAFCPVHGLFPTRGVIAASPGVNFEMLGCKVNCFYPGCDKQAEIIPGNYSSLPDSLNVFIDPSISPEALSAIKNIAERLQRKEITPEQAHKEASTFGDRVAELFRPNKLRSSSSAAIVSAIIAVSGAMGAAAIHRDGQVTAAQIEANAKINAAKIQADATIKENKTQSVDDIDSSNTSTTPAPKTKPIRKKQNLMNSTSMRGLPPFPRRKP